MWDIIKCIDCLLGTPVYLLISKFSNQCGPMAYNSGTVTERVILYPEISEQSNQGYRRSALIHRNSDLHRALMDSVDQTKVAKSHKQ